MFKFLKIITDFIVYTVLSLQNTSKVAQGLDFFIYNTLKVFILIIIIGFITGIVKTYSNPEKIKNILSKKKTGIGNIIAVIIGVVTPVESFSVVPTFIGFLEAGIPASVAFSYLVTAPMTSEIAFVVFWGFLGPVYAILYYACGIISGLVIGLTIGLLKLDNYVEPFVVEGDFAFKNSNNHKTIDMRIIEANENAKILFKNVWLYVLFGIGIAAIIHGYIPSDFLIKYAGLNNPDAVPFLVLLVFFFYVSIAAALPIMLIFITHGLPIGTILAFTMAITATSVPELLILKRILKTPLFIIYLILLFSSIIFTGLLLNTIFTK